MDSGGGKHYFKFFKLSEADKLEAAMVTLKCDALLGFHREHTHWPVTRWKEMKSLLLCQFGLVNVGILHQ